MKKHITLFFLFLLTSWSCVAADFYIIDDLPVYLRRGPSTEYRQIVTLVSGDKVTVLQKSDNGKYTQVKDDKGRVAWIESNLLSNTMSIKEKYPILEQENRVLQDKVKTLEESRVASNKSYAQQLDEANQKIAELEKAKNELLQLSKQQNEQIEVLSKQTDSERQDLMMKWFTRGGMVGGIGLVFGLILPLLISRRRKKDRWMS